MKLKLVAFYFQVCVYFEEEKRITWADVLGDTVNKRSSSFIRQSSDT